MLLFLLGCSENALVSKDDPVGGDDAVAAPDIDVAPVAVDFGAVLPYDAATAAVVLANVGDATLNLADLSVDAQDVTFTSLSSPMVPPGGEVRTVLTWTPVSADALDAALEIASDDPDEPVVHVPLTGTVPPGDLVITPTTHDFGTLAVGDTDTVTLTVQNAGDGLLTIDAMAYTANDADLAVVDAGDLAFLPAVLDPGASTEVVVAYTPSGAGPDEGTLTLSSDDPDAPVDGATQMGAGEEDDPCEGYTQTVKIMLTADDAWEGWIDGTSFTGPGAGDWTTHDTFEWEMECGDHALSLYATDLYGLISGVIAVVWVEGAVRFVSGPTDWTMVDTAPASGWTDPAFDDSSWHIPDVCATNSPWGSNPQPFYDQGAQWIWWDSNCSNLGEAWLRLNFTVP